jgi:hypothetical protein
MWQRFVLATALIFGLALGVAATVFGYSNTAPVTVGFSVYHLSGIPLWTVAVVPLVVVLVAGTLYHWYNNLHHFTEHMRHRRRVHELEEEVAGLRAHLDSLLEMPDHEKPTTAALEPVPAEPETVAAEAETVAAEPEPAPVKAERAPVSNGDEKPSRKAKKAAAVAEVSAANGDAESKPAEETPAEA